MDYTRVIQLRKCRENDNFRALKCLEVHLEPSTHYKIYRIRQMLGLLISVSEFLPFSSLMETSVVLLSNEDFVAAVKSSPIWNSRLARN